MPNTEKTALNYTYGMSKKVSKRFAQKEVLLKNPNSNLFGQLLLTLMITTITTFPFIFDSFTISKLFVLSVGLTLITLRIVLNKTKLHFNHLPRILMVTLILFLFSITVSWVISGVPLLRGLFGQFGRGNGLFYYFFAILVFFFTILTYKTENENQIHKLLTFLSWFMAAYATLQRMGIDLAELDTRGISPVVLTFGNSNFAGGMLSVLFAYHFTYIVIKKRVSPGQFALVVTLAISATFPAAVQGYLIILFAMAIGFSFFIARNVSSAWIKPTLIVGWVTAVFLVVLGVFGKFFLAGLFRRESFQARIEYWSISLKIMRDNLFFGVGPDKLYDVTSLYMSPGSLKTITTTRMDNAHNFYLNVGANFGLISMIFLIAIFIFVFLSCFHNFKQLGEKYAVSVASSVAFIAMFIDGLVSLEQPGIGIWLYFFAGVSLATAKSSFVFSLRPTEVASPEKSKKSIAPRFLAVTGVLVLGLSVLTIGNRVIFDGKLRRDVQTVLLNQGTEQTLSRIENSAIRLASEPEYIVQALSPIAKIGDASKIDSISKAAYKYYPLSIQASLIRADVLRALNREIESCLLRETLLSNTPWDLNQLESFVTCYLQGVQYKNSRQMLIKSEKYLPILDKSTIPADADEMINLVSRLKRVSVYARTYFIIGKWEDASNLKSYATLLFERLDELIEAGVVGPTPEEIAAFKKLLDF